MARSAGLLALLLGSAGARVAAQTHPAHIIGQHMRFMASRPVPLADTVRALGLVDSLRRAILPYGSLTAAQAAGFRVRNPQAMERRRGLLHVGRGGPARWGDAAFDPARPQALLFRREAGGSYRLAGAMFTAPGNSTEAELDARIPLSLARWHQHLNICRGTDGLPSRQLRAVSSAEACAERSGRFRSESRYMVHVMIDVGDKLDQIFLQRPKGDME